MVTALTLLSVDILRVFFLFQCGKSSDFFIIFAKTTFLL